MRNRDALGTYHPAVTFLLFAIIFTFSMVSMHPLCLLISVFSGISYLTALKGKKVTRFLLRTAMPLFLLTVLINPLFSHEGVTILCYFPTGNPLTLESIVYGIGAGLMLVGILLWFSCFSQVMTSDKFIFLFGTWIPALSLLISMALRFVPRFKAQLDSVREVQGALGGEPSSGSLRSRIKSAVTCFSVVITWSMESAIDTADSMKSRGYGTNRRSTYSIYRFEKRDRLLLIFLLLCGAALLIGGLCGGLTWSYFPNIRGDWFTPLPLVYLLLCFTPIYLNRREERMWKRSESTI